MQRALRMNDGQLLSLSEKALHDNCLRGYLCKRTADSARWQLRWFVLYQNLLFYYESDSAARPSGVLFLEGSYCERLLTPVTGKNTGSTQVSHSLAPAPPFFLSSPRRCVHAPWAPQRRASTPCDRKRAALGKRRDLWREWRMRHSFVHWAARNATVKSLLKELARD
ncbi:hypothetical protein HPB48_019345 [Haemaphysalis longicornis]|uniref:PH domain-containing protein n=1 Tax=Haemaphysalis longicornis TaxID=44386 RepID=A0A9J6G6Z2_HAELO|nr:hypothetical protein HPB48_019345 [Haemaphysalis longicornis]